MRRRKENHASCSTSVGAAEHRANSASKVARAAANSALASSTAARSVAAERSSASCSSGLRWGSMDRAAPPRPSATGRLIQQPSSGIQCETGRILALSKSTDEQMLDTMAPIPNDVAPLPSIMVAACRRHSSASVTGSYEPAGSACASGTPPTVAIDHAMNWLSPCSPRT